MRFGDVMNALIEGKISNSSKVKCIYPNGSEYSHYFIGQEGNFYGLYDRHGNIAKFDIYEINSYWKIKESKGDINE